MFIQKIVLFFFIFVYCFNLLACEDGFSLSSDEEQSVLGKRPFVEDIEVSSNGYFDLSRKKIAGDEAVKRVAEYCYRTTGTTRVYSLVPVSKFIPLLNKKRGKISKLNLSGNQLSPKALEVLFDELKEHKTLTAISIADNGTIEGVLNFAFKLHQHLPKLKDIDIRGNSDASWIYMDRFFKNLTLEDGNLISEATEEEKEDFRKKIIWRYDRSRYDARNIQWED